MKEQNHLLNALVMLQTFETNWAYYSQTSGYMHDYGHLCDGDCRESARRFFSSFQQLAANDERWSQIPDEVKQTLNALGAWDCFAEWPLENARISVHTLYHDLAFIKGLMIHRLGIAPSPLASSYTNHLEYRETVTRWRGHLPKHMLQGGSEIEDVMKKASSCNTIAVVGDIRRSQDLMTYAQDSETYTKYMADFIEKTQQLVLKHNGIFDKFTGDGFVAYFNEEICSSCAYFQMQQLLVTKQITDDEYQQLTNPHIFRLTNEIVVETALFARTGGVSSEW